MSIETRLRNTGQQGGAGGSSSSSGLMGTGNFLVTWSADPLIANERILTAGANITLTTDATTITVAATTGAAGASGGLASTGAFFVTYLADGTLSAERVLTAGSSVIVRTDGTNIYVDAITSGGFNFCQLLPQQAKLYASTSAARIDAGTAWWRLLFSATTQQYGVWQFVCPPDYGSNPYIRLQWAGGSTIAVVRSTTWTVDQWSISHDQATTPYFYQDTFGGANSVTIGLSAGYTSGVIQNITVPLVTTVSLAAGRITHLRLTGTGNFAGDAIMGGMTFEYTRA